MSSRDILPGPVLVLNSSRSKQQTIWEGYSSMLPLLQSSCILSQLCCPCNFVVVAGMAGSCWDLLWNAVVVGRFAEGSFSPRIAMYKAQTASGCNSILQSGIFSSINFNKLFSHKKNMRRVLLMKHEDKKTSYFVWRILLIILFCEKILSSFYSMWRILLVNKFATIAGLLARKPSHTWLALCMCLELYGWLKIRKPPVALCSPNTWRNN